MHPASMMRRTTLGLLPLLTLAITLGGCSNGNVDDSYAAELAYLGLDRAVDRMIKLGFDGYNAAGSANIPLQSEAGEEQGTMEVDGKVDQGASANKGMQLDVVLNAYSDGDVGEPDYSMTYTGGPLQADFQLKGLPDAELTGSLAGVLTMEGSLSGTIELDLAISGQTQDVGGGVIARVPGSIQVVGTATSDYGIFAVDVIL